MYKKTKLYILAVQNGAKIGDYDETTFKSKLKLRKRKSSEY